ncbi:olfactory receptor 1020-like [Sphaerodactylus townsendi]|uniref:olfactory receptor 1020-like n=1 Tax=Sphaerodactylus townsendi TaxID=933632 RepID=UPI002026B70E|nr:olfactory receptor 1020-like [Sphaerodactylus townsendi]
MEMRNKTLVTEFMFTGLTDIPELQIVLFVMFVAFYAITLVGNLGMIALIRLSPQLHTPMYFFLSHLSFLDVCYSSSVTPKLLTDLLREKKLISSAGCLIQFYFYAVFATTECYLLAVMAYDRYVAICSPLLYLVTMSLRKRVYLIAVAYAAGIVNALIHTVAASRLSFCGLNTINHFYCEGPPLFAISCSDVSLNELLMFVCVGFNWVATILTILISYTCILLTILKISSSKSRQKTFSTCTSHLIVIIIFYGGFGIMYARPSARQSHNLDKIVSVLYIVVTPMVNPMIYSLRNTEVRNAFRKFLGRFVFQHV